MIHRIFITIFSLFTLAMCTGQKTTSEASEQTLKEGENIYLKNADINIGFKKIVEDSRCPKGVNCIWEGNAKAQIELSNSVTKPVLAEISTANRPQQNMNNSVIFNGHKIQLVEVQPYPSKSSGLNENSGKYVIKLKVIKLAENQMEPSVQ